jgi:hypothetical protein
MADSFDVDASEVRILTVALTNSTRGIESDVRAVVSKGALNIKNQMVAEMASSPHFKGTARAITYDMTGNGLFSEAQIGPKVGDGESGGLAGFAYFGGSNGGGGTVPDPRLALEREAPNFERALGEILGGLL